MFAFVLAFAWLTSFFTFEWQKITMVGGAWGAAAGAGRLWIQRGELPRRLAIPLVSIVSGLALVVFYLGLSPQWLDSLESPLLRQGLVFVIGILVPLVVLVAEDAAITSEAGQTSTARGSVEKI